MKLCVCHDANREKWERKSKIGHANCVMSYLCGHRVKTILKLMSYYFIADRIAFSCWLFELVQILEQKMYLVVAIYYLNTILYSYFVTNQI